MAWSLLGWSLLGTRRLRQEKLAEVGGKVNGTAETAPNGLRSRHRFGRRRFGSGGMEAGERTKRGEPVPRLNWGSEVDALKAAARPTHSTANARGYAPVVVSYRQISTHSASSKSVG